METVAGGVRVKMRLKGSLGPNPIRRYYGLIMNSYMGDEFEESLKKLKAVVEQG